MKLGKLAMIVTMVTGCASSNALPRSVYEARDGVNEVGERVQAKVRPTVAPVAASVDRGFDQAVASLGLRGNPAKN